MTLGKSLYLSFLFLVLKKKCVFFFFNICLATLGLCCSKHNLSLWCSGSLAVAWRLSWSDTCRILVSQPGIKLMFLALQHRFLTTGPPGKSVPLFSDKKWGGGTWWWLGPLLLRSIQNPSRGEWWNKAATARHTCPCHPGAVAPTLQSTVAWNTWPAQVPCMRQGAQGWCTRMTLRDGVGREVGRGLRMGDTCTSMEDSHRCVAKTTTIL